MLAVVVFVVLVVRVVRVVRVCGVVPPDVEGVDFGDPSFLLFPAGRKYPLTACMAVVCLSPRPLDLCR